MRALVLLALALPALAQSVPGAREILTLSSGWRFQLDVADLGEKEHWFGSDFDRSRWGAVQVPKAWDLLDHALWGYEGVGWYTVRIDGAQARPGKVQRLKLGRVNYHTKAWLNGEFLGENANGWMPFEFNLTGKLKRSGGNDLVLRVDNRPRIHWLPGASRIEWVQYGGILQPVTLETSAPVYISDIAIEARTSRLACVVEIMGGSEQDVTVRVRAAGATASEIVHATARKAAAAKLSLEVPGASLWSPESPRLYQLVAAIEAGGHVVDRAVEKFGIRKIEVSGRRVLLNGKPIEFRGVNRYDEYGGYGPNPPRELVIEDLRTMKAAGVNAVRVHYPQAPDLISLYDEMGFVMIEELPINWWTLYPNGKDKPENDILGVAMAGLERMIRRDKNHPSIVIWSMGNESPTDTETGIRTMRALMSRARELDSTRLITYVSAPGDLGRQKAYSEADLVGANMYAGTLSGPIAHHMDQIETLVRQRSIEYLRKTAALFPDKPVIVTEFGNRGIRAVHGDAPYTEELQAASIKAIWSAIRECKEISGGVLWSWADYYHRRDFIQYAPFGPYGVVTVDRRPKAALAALAEMYGGTARRRDQAARKRATASSSSSIPRPGSQGTSR